LRDLGLGVQAHADRFTAELLVPTLQRLGVTPDQRARRSVLEVDLDDAASSCAAAPDQPLSDGRPPVGARR
jgi:hypothetical protein